jgi:cholesterol oxidase
VPTGRASGVTDAHGGGPADPIVATGIMHLSAADFAKQMTTMRVTGVASRAERLRWMAKFDTHFLKSLLTVYGGPLDNVGQFPATKREPIPLVGAGGQRKLRLPAPEPRWRDGSGRWHEGNDLGDDANLRLVRFEGGRRGPVLLASGFGMSATSYLLGTVDTNLPEHLVEKGYDVWLFDYRAGIDLPSSRTSFTMDDIALRDWPAAVTEVLRITGAGSVQALGHCVGSASLMMALAAGMSDVRSAVCMQFTLDPITSWVNQAKVSLGVGVETCDNLRGARPSFASAYGTRAVASSEA